MNEPMSIDEYLRRVSAAVQESLAGLAPQQPTPEQRLRDLRDHFAGLAMQGIFAADTHCNDVGEHFDCNSRYYDEAARHAYLMADAMLKARGEQP